MIAKTLVSIALTIVVLVNSINTQGPTTSDLLMTTNNQSNLTVKVL
jgi:hypothetical protein